jgi:arylformamidase
LSGGLRLKRFSWFILFWSLDMTTATAAAPPLPQSPAWLDAMYNNRALVPDFADHLNRWAQDSAQVRQSAVCHLDVRYGAGLNERLDVFPASSTTGSTAADPSKLAPTMAASSNALAPVLVFIHGGYWRSLDKADHSFIAPAFTAAGTCVVVPNYALCPAVTVPDIVLQMVKAMAWVHQHIQSYGGDPQRISVIGHSAGGHLAAMLLGVDWTKLAQTGLPGHGQTQAAALPANLLKSALSISGLFDLAPIQYTPFLQDDLRLTDEVVQKISPVHAPAPAQGRLLSVVGADESAEFIRQNALIQRAWGRQAVPVCEALLGLNHFSILAALCEPAHRLHQLALQLMQKQPL